MNQNNNMVNKKKIKEENKEDEKFKLQMKEVEIKVIKGLDQQRKWNEWEAKIEADKKQKDMERSELLLDIYHLANNAYEIVQTKNLRSCPVVVKSGLTTLRKYLKVKTCQGPCGKGSKQILHHQGGLLYCMDCTKSLVVKGKVIKEALATPSTVSSL